MGIQDEVVGQAEIFAIGIGECGSNLVASYMSNTDAKGRSKSRIREFLIMNTDRADLTKTVERYNIS